MNLASLHSPEHDYASGALARFAASGFALSKPIDLLGAQSNDRPPIRCAAQLRLWTVLTEATRPLNCAEIYARYPNEVDETDKNGIRNQLVKWAYAKWLTREGVTNRQKYAIKKRIPKL